MLFLLLGIVALCAAGIYGYKVMKYGVGDVVGNVDAYDDEVEFRDISCGSSVEERNGFTPCGKEIMPGYHKETGRVTLA